MDQSVRGTRSLANVPIRAYAISWESKHLPTILNETRQALMRSRLPADTQMPSPLRLPRETTLASLDVSSFSRCSRNTLTLFAASPLFTEHEASPSFFDVRPVFPFLFFMILLNCSPILSRRFPNATRSNFYCFRLACLKWPRGCFFDRALLW